MLEWDKNDTYLDTPMVKNPLGVVKKCWNFIYHYINGWYSGIPKCCIRHFCNLDWQYATPTSFLSEWLYGSKDGANYVRCSKCRDEGYEVKLKKAGNFFPKSIKPFYCGKNIDLRNIVVTKKRSSWRDFDQEHYHEDGPRKLVELDENRSEKRVLWYSYKW